MKLHLTYKFSKTYFDWLPTLILLFKARRETLYIYLNYTSADINLLTYIGKRLRPSSQIVDGS